MLTSFVTFDQFSLFYCPFIQFLDCNHAFPNSTMSRLTIFYSHCSLHPNSLLQHTQLSVPRNFFNIINSTRTLILPFRTNLKCKNYIITIFIYFFTMILIRIHITHTTNWGLNFIQFLTISIVIYCFNLIIPQSMQKI